MSLRNSLFVIGFCVAGICNAQELVKDINNIPGSIVRFPEVYEERCVPCGGYVYFVAIDAEHGSELWRTDGTAEGTKLTKDIWPGTNTGVEKSAEIVCVNNKVFFRDLNSGVWKSDGTEAGTVELDGSLFVDRLTGIVRFQDKVVYQDGENVYMSNGEAGNKTLIHSFPDAANEYNRLTLAPGDNIIFVMVTRTALANGDVLGYELWAYNGTSTTLVKSFEEVENFVGQSTTLGDKVIFGAHDDVHGSEYWVSDGTTAGTQILMEANAGSAGVVIARPNKANGKVFLGQQLPGRATWVSDGTPAGTTKIIDGFEARSTQLFGDKIYMTGYDNGDYYVSRMDLDYSNRINVSLPGENLPLIMQEVGGRLLYAISDETVGDEMYYLDGAVDPISILKDINPGEAGSQARAGAVLNGSMIFIADDGEHGFELWKTDGTADGTVLLKDIATNTGDPQITDIYVRNDKMYFLANDFDRNAPSNLSRKTLWVSDGSEAGTQRVNDTKHNIFLFAPAGDRVVTITNDYGATKTDLTTGTTNALPDFTDFVDYLGFDRYHSVAVGDDVYSYFQGQSSSGTWTGIELWRTNAESNEFGLVKDIIPGTESSAENDGVNGVGLNGKLVFSANVQGSEPWVTDGTEEGTFKLKDIGPDFGSSPAFFTNVGNYVLFFASDAVSTGLWRTDGTSEGTVPVKQDGGINRNEPGRIGNKIIFTGSSDVVSRELWITDGTNAGTSLVKQITSPGYVSDFMTVGDKVYFLVNTASLWVTDGTEAGTKDTGVRLTRTPLAYTSKGDMLIFEDTGAIRCTLGTPETTHSIATVMPAGKMYVIGDYLYFLTDDLQYGRELFKVAIPEVADQEITIDGVVDFVFGEEYTITATSTSGLPVVMTTSDPSVATFDGNKLIIHKAGPVTIIASQSGNEAFRPATKSVQGFTAKANQVINFAEISAQNLDDEEYELDAAATSDLPVKYSALSTTVGKVVVDENVLMFAMPGKVTVTAMQDGDDNYNPAEPVSQTFCINPSAPTITRTGAGLEVTLTSSATVNVWTLNDEEMEFTGSSFVATEDGTYKAAAVVDECQSDFSNPVNFILTGLEDENGSVGIFPNPAEKDITIRSQPNSQVRILDVAGKEQINEITRAGESVIDVSSFAAGMYFIIIKTETQTHRSKFLKR